MDSHLDAERLAAFVDGSLSRAERSACEAHAADCPRCLQLLAAMARTDEAVPKPPRLWSRIPVVVRWGVPFAAAAIALALWVNVQPQLSQSAPAAPVAAPERSPAPPQAAESRPAPASAPDALPDAAGMKAATSVRDEKRERRSAPAPQATAKAAENPSVDALTRPGLPRAQPAAPALPPVAAPSAVPPAVTNESAARLRADSMDRLMTTRTAAVVEVVSPDPSSRWRAMGAAILRSTDGGKTWTTHAVSPRLELLTGSSPSRTVAWLVGRAGGVLLCVDAGDCRQLPFPEAADLTAVRALSELQAEVTTADGRAFATSDGGKTWTRK